MKGVAVGLFDHVHYHPRQHDLAPARRRPGRHFVEPGTLDDLAAAPAFGAVLRQEDPRRVRTVEPPTDVPVTVGVLQRSRRGLKSSERAA